MIDKPTLTTGDIARLCHVSPRTVARWSDMGWLKGYRLPGSLDRRFPSHCVREFLKEHGMEIPDDLNSSGTP